MSLSDMHNLIIQKFYFEQNQLRYRAKSREIMMKMEVAEDDEAVSIIQKNIYKRTE